MSLLALFAQLDGGLVTLAEEIRRLGLVGRQKLVRLAAVPLGKLQTVYQRRQIDP